MTAARPTRTARVRATAPVRVADVGGWTDTWFGAPGRVCHLAVGPGVTVDVGLVERRAGEAPVRVDAPALGPAFDLAPGPEGLWGAPAVGADPLIAAAVAEVVGAGAPGVDRLGPDRRLEVTIGSTVPAGASLGTSASVLVAVAAALRRALGGPPRPAGDWAVLAHRIETGRAGREAGVQDHWAAACGGAQLLHVAPYPSVRREPVELAPEVEQRLGRHLVTVVFGPHDSSAVHRQVIDGMVSCGGAEHDRVRRTFERLSGLAAEAASALAAGDLDGWAAVLVASTEAQAGLHPDLVGPAHHAAIDLARAHGASGWKVNGAGGAGGSLTVLVGERPAELAAAYAEIPGWQVAALALSPGVTVTTSA